MASSASCSAPPSIEVGSKRSRCAPPRSMWGSKRGRRKPHWSKWGLSEVDAPPWVEVGTRSRLFRTDLIRRQRVRDLVAGIVFIELGVVLYTIGGWQTTRGASSWGDMFQTFGIAVSLVASLLVLVGLIYLCMNLFWIRQALLSPPRRLREYLDPPMESSGP